MFKRILLILLLTFSCSFAFSDEQRVIINTAQDKEIWKTTDDFFMNDINRYFCLTFGTSGCAAVAAYGSTAQVYKQIENMSREELNEYTKSNGKSFEFFGVAINAVQSKVIGAGVFSLVLFLVLAFKIGKGTGTSSVKQYSKISLGFSAAVISIIVSTSYASSITRTPNILMYGYLVPVGALHSISEQLYTKKMGFLRIYFDPIKKPDTDSLTLEMPPILDFTLCVAANGGSNVNLNFERLTDKVLRAKASFKNCLLSVDIGYDPMLSEINEKYELNNSNIENYQIEKLKTAINNLLLDASQIVEKTISAYGSGSNEQTINTLNTNAAPASTIDSYIYFKDSAQRLSKSFVNELSSLKNSGDLVNDYVQLCSSTLETSGGRPFFRPGKGEQEIAECVAEACAQSLYACKTAIYLQKEVKMFSVYKEKGIFSYPTVFLKQELSLNESPQDVLVNFNSSFEINDKYESQKDSSSSLFTSTVSIAGGGKFDYEEFRRFENIFEDEFNKRFDTPDYPLYKIFENDNGLFNLKKTIVCTKFSNAYRIVDGYSCGSIFKEIKDMARSVDSFVLQVNLAFRNNKIMNRFSSKYLDPTKSVQRTILINALQTVGASAAVKAVIETNSGNNVYGDIKSKYLISNTTFATLALTMLLNDKMQDRVLKNVNNVGITVGIAGESFQWTIAFLMMLAILTTICVVVAFAFLFPLLAFMFAKMAYDAKRNSVQVVIDFIVEKALPMLFIFGAVLMLNAVITIVTVLVDIEDIAYHLEITQDTNSIVGFFRYMMSCIVAVYLIFHLTIKHASEPGKSIKRAEQEITGDFNYEVEDDEKHMLDSGKNFRTTK